MIAKVYIKFGINMLEFFSPIADLLKTEPTVLIVFATIIGLLVGSFLNVVIHRLPIMMEQEWHANCLELQGKDAEVKEKYTLVTPRSACPKCQHKITASENIPLISYLVLGGKCSACKTKISIRYPLVEAFTGALIGAVAYQYGYSGITLFASLFVFALVALTFIDADTQLLPDSITLPLLWLGLLFNLSGGLTDINSAVIGAMAGYLSLWSIYWLFKIATGKEGMGYGDFKLLAAIGAWFGWQILPAVILLSSVVGAIIGIAMMSYRGKDKNMAMPFGPFLALGGLAALFYGQTLAQLYLVQ
jgi:leader peptidase (prepilin peptidase) / N-methyltransferase